MEVKVKVKLSLCVTKHLAMKAYLLLNQEQYKDALGSGGIAPRFLDFGTR
jgi:hypothetical protein